jgi:hypothetical protein
MLFTRHHSLFCIYSYQRRHRQDLISIFSRRINGALLQTTVTSDLTLAADLFPRFFLLDHVTTALLTAAWPILWIQRQVSEAA